MVLSRLINLRILLSVCWIPIWTLVTPRERKRLSSNLVIQVHQIWEKVYRIYLRIYQYIRFNNTSTSDLIIHNIKYSILFILALLSISNYGIILGSWASHNKFAVFSAVRTLALTNSYGISISLIFLYPCALSNSYNIFDIISAQKYTLWFIVPGLPLAILYWIIVLTEIKKIPFDVTESEAELGSGYLIEYSGMGFALFIISEYCYILIVSILFVCCFLGGYWWRELKCYSGCCRCCYSVRSILGKQKQIKNPQWKPWAFK